MARLSADPGLGEWGTIWLPGIERHTAITALRNDLGQLIANIPLLAERDRYFHPGKARDIIPGLDDEQEGQ